MKWLIGILIALNLFVFLLANFSQDNNQNHKQTNQLAENVSSIKLVDSTASPLPGNCSNVGPIEQQIVLDQFEKVLAEKSLSYRVISEAARKVAAYRVVIPIEKNTNVSELKQRLKATGVEESFEKTLANGQSVLSLGVFTYKNTATELANNLKNTGFSATAEREFLQFPQRYWVNLNQSLEQSVLVAMDKYAGKNKLQQTAAKCL